MAVVRHAVLQQAPGGDVERGAQRRGLMRLSERGSRVNTQRLGYGTTGTRTTHRLVAGAIVSPLAEQNGTFSAS